MIALGAAICLAGCGAQAKSHSLDRNQPAASQTRSVAPTASSSTTESVSPSTPSTGVAAELASAEADSTLIQTSAGSTTVGAVISAVVANSALVGQVQAAATTYATQLATAAAIDPATLAALQANPGNTVALVTALREISQRSHVDQATALGQLRMLSTLPASVSTLFGTTAPQALGAANFAALLAVGTPNGNQTLARDLMYLSDYKSSSSP